MLTNDQMRPYRFQRMMECRILYRKIESALASGLRIQVTTYAHSKVYTNLEQFKLGKTGVYVARGKHWDDISGCSIRSVL